MAPPSLVTTVSLFEISWRYLGEGNRHIVLALLESDSVLRLHKNVVPNVNLEESIRAAAEFVNSVMLPMILISSPIIFEEVIAVAEGEIERLNKELANIRPPSRVHKLICSKFGTRAPNYTLVPNCTGTSYCVEIKPKLGFMPEELRKYGKCAFCLKQYLKLNLKQITNLGDYCPLDLFSGIKSRMIKSLLSLTNNPQNNFKIFKNSEIIFSSSSEPDSLCRIMRCLPFKNSMMFLEFLTAILVSEPHVKNNTGTCVTQVDLANITCSSKDSLPPNSVLGRILYLQKLWTKCEVNPQMGDYDYVEPLLDYVRECNVNLCMLNHRNEFLKKCNDISRCMIAAVARDCSIMISFSESTSPTENVQVATIDGRQFIYHVAVTDLEPKPISTIEKRKMVDSDITKVFKDNKDHNMSCT